MRASDQLCQNVVSRMLYTILNPPANRLNAAAGRLYVYGFTAAGPGSVVRLFEILEDEIRICLGLLGFASFAELTKAYSALDAFRLERA